MIGVRKIEWMALVALPVAVLSLIVRRWFCRYACPVGLLLETVERIRPKTRNRPLHVLAIGRWLVWLTLGGALAGFPIFLFLDPLALFNGFLNAWRKPIEWIVLLTGLGLPLLMIINTIVPRLWCRCICPLGATQDFLFGLRHVFRFNVPAPQDRAIGMVNIPQARRGFLAACAGIAGGFALKAIGKQTSPPLRPPGSIEEDRFMGVCVRCGNCARACSSNIIQPDFGEGGITGLFTPRLCFDEDYCREDCHQCNNVCPSGAIARLSLAEKRKHVIGLAAVDVDLCLLAKGRECTACIRRCPYKAIVMQSMDDGFSNAPMVVPNRCNGCGACEAICPTHPVRAIRVRVVVNRGDWA